MHPSDYTINTHTLKWKYVQNMLVRKANIKTVGKAWAHLCENKIVHVYVCVHACDCLSTEQSLEGIIPTS